MTVWQMNLLFSLVKKMTIIQQNKFATFLEEEVKIQKGWSNMTDVVIERLAEEVISN